MWHHYPVQNTPRGKHDPYRIFWETIAEFVWSLFHFIGAMYRAANTPCQQSALIKIADGLATLPLTNNHTARTEEMNREAISRHPGLPTSPFRIRLEWGKNIELNVWL